MFLIEAATAEGTKVINQRCWVRYVDGKREVWVNWCLFLSYPAEDAPSRRFAAASLAQSGVASKTKIAKAFGYHRNYVAELTNRLESQGLEGMLEGKRGPKGPNKLHPHMRRRARELRQQGMSLQGIAKQLQKEYRVSISHTSVRGMVIGVETEGKDEKQASLDGPWPLVMPLSTVGALPSTPLASSMLAEQLAETAVAAATKVEDSTEGVPPVDEQPVQPVKPDFTEDRDFAGAGGFLHYAALAALGLVDVFQKVYHGLAGRRYGLREFVLTLFFLCVMGFPSLESLKRTPRRDLGCIIGASRSPAVKTAQRKLQDLAEQKQGHRLVMEMAQRYVDGDIVDVGVLYADGHVKPYYGSRSLGEVWSPQRRMPVTGIQQYFVNDGNGQPLFFLTPQPNQSLTQMLPRLVEHIRSVIGEREFTLIFDRGGYSPKVFRLLHENKVHIITYRRKPFDLYPASAFSRQTCEFKRVRREFDLYETTVRLKEIGTMRNIAILREKGRQTHILTTDQKTEPALIACLMINRWGQENFFKYMMEHYSLDLLHSYGGTAISDELVVANPERQAMDKQVRELRCQIKSLREQMGALVAKNTAEEQLEPLRQQMTSLEGRLKDLTRQRRQTPRRVSLGETPLKLERLNLEKKVIQDTVKMAAYNAEEWLLQRLNEHYDDPRDIRQVLRIFTGLKGRLHRCNDDIIVDLKPPDLPKYRQALEGLCAKLNSLSTCFPGTPYHIKFAVAGIGMHTKPHSPTGPMS
ncbi:MAG: transposase [Dehalococcoidia bacterium]|nr:transposase [Dehalococcoidia bacterium]